MRRSNMSYSKDFDVMNWSSKCLKSSAIATRLNGCRELRSRVERIDSPTVAFSIFHINAVGLHLSYYMQHCPPSTLKSAPVT